MKIWSMKCNHCDHIETLEADLPTFDGAGLQCEFFYNHLAENHDIHCKLVGLGTVSSCLFGIDEEVTNVDKLIPMYGGVDLGEHFTCIGEK